jgi:4a-hydroxytetrahydrobiopterin dehydratase
MIARLDLAACNDRIASLGGWRLSDDGLGLRRDFAFADFVQAFGFMTQVSLLAERADHHPEWSNVYNRVTIYLTTHDAGGISERDFSLAQAIDRIGAPCAVQT